MSRNPGCQAFVGHCLVSKKMLTKNKMFPNSLKRSSPTTVVITGVVPVFNSPVNYISLSYQPKSTTKTENKKDRES